MALLLLFLDQGVPPVDILLDEGIVELRDVLQLRLIVCSHCRGFCWSGVECRESEWEESKERDGSSGVPSAESLYAMRSAGMAPASQPPPQSQPHHNPASAATSLTFGLFTPLTAARPQTPATPQNPKSWSHRGSQNKPKSGATRISVGAACTRNTYAEDGPPRTNQPA